ncbi:MAG: DUF3754 domain-containing protein [Phycisphaerales bacterium]
MQPQEPSRSPDPPDPAAASHADEKVTARRLHDEAEAALDTARSEQIDERFIPIALDSLIAALAERAREQGHDAPGLERLCFMLRGIVEQEADALRRALDRMYDPLNPDRDVICQSPRGEGKDPPSRAHLATAIGYVLEKANYRKLEQVDIEEAVRMANTQGVRIRLRDEMVQSLDLWIRGLAVERRKRRTRKAPIRGQWVDIPVYRRLVVIARLRNDASLYLKLYRSIPTADLEALLPHAQVAMNTLDRLKIACGAGGALGSIGGAATAASGGLLAVLYALAIPFGLLGWRALSGYRRARVERDRQLTRNLFFLNLASNASVLHTIAARLAEEEAKEVILAYAAALLAPETTSNNATECERCLDQWCESFLRERFGITINFDAPDAIETIERIGLWTDRQRLRVEPIPRAYDIAERHWSQRRSWDYHERAIAARPADPDATKT